jgi:hypothetical protein
MFKNLLLLSVVLLPVHQLQAQQHVFFATKDGGKICADVYGKGKRAVVLAHGGRFTRSQSVFPERFGICLDASASEEALW